MFFKHFYDEDLAQGSYLIGCQATGEAIVVDARRDIETFINEAERNDLRITKVTETHIHADYLSGSKELAETTGAELYLSDEGNQDWKYGFKANKLYDGDIITVGNINIQVVHTPGHTPEHLSFLITDTPQSDKPGYFLTGDFVFVGDIGRPDLLDEVAGGQDSRYAGAKQLFNSLKTKFLTLPDYVQVWPGHGAGSACGKALGAISSTTVGYEKTVAWWVSYLNNNDEQGFIDALLDGQPDAPQYFARMKRHNKQGPAPRKYTGDIPELQAEDLKTKSSTDYLLIDTRSRDAYISGHVSGSLHVPDGKKFATYASYIINPETEQRDIILLARNAEHAKQLRDKLSYIGVDNVTGFITSLESFPVMALPMITVDALASLTNPFILDVRSQSEYDEGHIPGSTRVPVGRLMWQLDALPLETPLVVHCQSGVRATVSMSALHAAGFTNAVELEGSYLHYQDVKKEKVAG